MAADVTVPIAGAADILTARQAARTLAGELGFGVGDATLIATAISELARNIAAYAGHGEIRLTVTARGSRRGLEVEAVDEGPGIDDIAAALQDGYSTSGGLGLGLPGARRLMDEFEIHSEPGEGTTVLLRRWLTDRG